MEIQGHSTSYLMGHLKLYSSDLPEDLSPEFPLYLFKVIQ